jgi:hypothetical protein
MLLFLYASPFILCSLLFYYYWVKRLASLSWKEAQTLEKQPHQYDGWERQVGQSGRIWLFSGPAGAQLQNLYEDLVHLPMQFFRVSKLFFVTLPSLQMRLLFHALLPPVRLGRLPLAMLLFLTSSPTAF